MLMATWLAPFPAQCPALSLWFRCSFDTKLTCSSPARAPPSFQLLFCLLLVPASNAPALPHHCMPPHTLPMLTCSVAVHCPLLASHTLTVVSILPVMRRPFFVNCTLRTDLEWPWGMGRARGGTGAWG